MVIASGDRDFVPLVQKLKRYGTHVIGMGVENAVSPVLAQACNSFVYYDTLVPPESEEERPEVPEQDMSVIHSLLVRAIRAVSGEERPTNSQNVLAMMRQLDSTFDLGHYRMTFQELLEGAQESGYIAVRKESQEISPGEEQPRTPAQSPRRDYDYSSEGYALPATGPSCRSTGSRCCPGGSATSFSPCSGTSRPARGDEYRRDAVRAGEVHGQQWDVDQPCRHPETHLLPEFRPPVFPGWQGPAPGAGAPGGPGARSPPGDCRGGHPVHQPEVPGDPAEGGSAPDARSGGPAALRDDAGEPAQLSEAEGLCLEFLPPTAMGRAFQPPRTARGAWNPPAPGDRWTW